jgi:tRNA/tmRNA/rRNA uracil-C5-methylase (TrmA/RlmC/RlmD family)
VHSAELREAAAFLAGRVPADLPLCFLQVSGEIATLVIKSATLTEEAEARLRSLWPVPGLRGLFVNLNPSAGDRVFSNKGWRLLAGEPYATYRGGKLLGGREFRYGAQSFQQLIPSLFEEALGAAAGHLAPSPGSSVLDLCSGIGVSLAHWRSLGARTLGIELSGEAVACAELNAGAGSCLRGRVEDRRPQADEWLEAGGDRDRHLFANPPRTGLGPEVCSWIGGKVRPERLAYLSCSAGTLAKDLSVLADSGYAVRKILPYDFFPQTHHVETLALLARES